MATETILDNMRHGNSIRATFTIRRSQLYLGGQHPCSFYWPLRQYRQCRQFYRSDSTCLTGFYRNDIIRVQGTPTNVRHSEETDCGISMVSVAITKEHGGTHYRIRCIDVINSYSVSHWRSRDDLGFVVADYCTRAMVVVTWSQLHLDGERNHIKESKWIALPCRLPRAHDSILSISLAFKGWPKVGRYW